jgi:mannose-6-phosphate isomerase
MGKEARDFGGNVVRSIDATQPGRHSFADGPYAYFLHVSAGREEICVPHLQSYSAFVLSIPEGAHISLRREDAQSQDLNVGDAIQVESARPSLVVVGAGVRVLVAGTRHASPLASGVVVTPLANAYTVHKPWGHELWINGQHPNYALKQIAIERGTKTSLQYHLKKEETNVLFQGSARLTYNMDSQVSSSEVGPTSLASVDLRAVCSIGVVPPVVHRLEALDDVLLYEVSTPHLDDVMRIQDDSGRNDGRIKAEHP